MTSTKDLKHTERIISNVGGYLIGNSFKVPFSLKIENNCNTANFGWKFDFCGLPKEYGDRFIEIVMEQARKVSTNPPIESYYPLSEKDFQSKDSCVEMIKAQSYDQGVKWKYKISTDNNQTFSTEQKVRWSVTDPIIMFVVKLTVIKKSPHDNETESSRVTFLMPLKSKDISTQSVLNILRIDNGRSGKSSMIDTLFQSLGSHLRPSSHYPVDSQNESSELKVFTCLDPGGSPHFNVPFRFIDAKGFRFDTKDECSMERLQKILEGLPEGTLETNCLESQQNLMHKPKFTIISSDARTLVYKYSELNWVSSFIFNPSFSIDESILDKMIALKNKIDETLGQDRTVFIFTHMDMISPPNQSLLMQKLVEKNISPNVVFYTAKDKNKCTQECEDYCDHWTEETLSGLFQMLCNFKVTSQDH